MSCELAIDLPEWCYLQAHVQTCECMCVCVSISAYQSVHWLYIPVSLCTFPNSLLFIVGLKSCFISHPARVRVGVHELAVRQASQVSPAALCFCECVHVGLEVQVHVTYRSSEQRLVSGLFFVCSASPKLSDVCLSVCLSGPACQRRAWKGKRAEQICSKQGGWCLRGLWKTGDFF